MDSIDRARIEDAHAVLSPYVRVTPVLRLDGADFGLSPFPLTLAPLTAGGRLYSVDAT